MKTIRIGQEKVLNETYRTIFNGIDYVGLQDAMIMSCRCLIESHPDYSFVAARILRKKILDEGLSYYNKQTEKLSDHVQDYADTLPKFIQAGIDNQILNPELAEFDTAKLIKAMDCSQDYQFTYLSLQTLYDRYFIHDNLVL